LNIDMRDIEKRRNINKKVRKDISKKMIEDPTYIERDSININDSDDILRRSSKLSKKTKRL
jgi:hypothetical protein